MTDHQQLLDPLNKEQEPAEPKDQAEQEVQSYEYKIPRIPAYTAYCLDRIYYYTTPYWISEFLIYIVKSNLVRDGVSVGDWIILFFWLICQALSRHLAILAIRQGTCSITSYFIYYVLFAAFSIFCTIFMMSLAKTVLFFEIIFSVIAIILQIIVFIGTFMSFFMQLSPKAKSN